MTHPIKVFASAEEAPMSIALRDILDERRRQIEKEGFTLEKDNRYQGPVLAAAAVCYAYTAISGSKTSEDKFVDAHWPWAPGWWKPKSPRRNLVRAAALIVAEIERVDRLYEVDVAKAGQQPRSLLTEHDVIAAHAQFGQLDKQLVKNGMGKNWPAHWENTPAGRGIFAPVRDHSPSEVR